MEDNISQIAYMLYVEDNNCDWENISVWWKANRLPTYQKYINQAILIMRKEKINKILNG